MIEVVSIKFKNRGKCYFFASNGNTVKAGDKVIVDTVKGLEIADCCYGNHMVEDTAVVQPLRNVVRTATQEDLRIETINRQREKEAFEICQQKIAEHKLDMKLVDVECNFEGNKTLFFFTSDGRVDFRELVKDLAAIFRNRIELRQIGVRDEAKMIGGIGICGRPYCCNQFLDDFQPVSTKMAKTQSLSLNPTKISGSCGRLMCCLRYEEEAYEDLVKNVPKQGAFVQTKDGYGTAVQVNLLRQTVKVKLDNDSDDTLRTFKSNELATVPGGRPKEGDALPDVFVYVPEPEEEQKVIDEWELPEQQADGTATGEEEPGTDENTSRRRPRRRSRNKNRNNDSRNNGADEKPAAQPAPTEPTVQSEKTDKSGKNSRRRHKKPVKVEAKTADGVPAQVKVAQHHDKPAEKAADRQPKQQTPNGEAKPAKANRKRRYYPNRRKSGGGSKQE